jgi:hypothetical protein
MKITIAIILLAGALALPLPAHAAEPVLCGHYARDFTAQIIKFVWNRSYNYCLVRDQVPDLPRDWDSEMRIVLPDATPIAIVPLDQIGIVPATDAAVPPSPPARPVATPQPAHDAAWAARCARGHPHGWDARTGTVTVLEGRRWVRVPCAG